MRKFHMGLAVFAAVAFLAASPYTAKADSVSEFVPGGRGPGHGIPGEPPAIPTEPGRPLPPPPTTGGPDPLPPPGTGGPDPLPPGVLPTVLPIRFDAHDRESCVHALTTGLHGIGASVALDNFRPQDYCARRFPDTDMIGLVFDSGFGSDRLDTMTYDKYEGAMYLHALADGEINAIRPNTWYCNGACHWEAKLFEAEGVSWEEQHPGRLLGHASKSMHGEETMETGRLFAHFGHRIKIQKGHHYVLVQKVHTSKSIGVRTVGSGPYTSSSSLFEYRSLFGRMSGTQDSSDRGCIGAKLYDTHPVQDAEVQEQEGESGEGGGAGGGSGNGGAE